MKKFLLILCLFVCGTSLSQNDKKINDIVDVSLYRENGSLEQEGTYKKGKAHGKWIYYNNDGDITMIGFYNEGIKTGTWLFKRDNSMKEVLYENNKIVMVNSWDKTEKLIVIN